MIYKTANTWRHAIYAYMLLMLSCWNPSLFVKAFVAMPFPFAMPHGAVGKYVNTNDYSAIPKNSRRVGWNDRHASSLSSSSSSTSTCLSLAAMQTTTDTTTTTTTTVVEESTSDDGTLHNLTLAFHNNGTAKAVQFTLIGTAHLSEKSNQQVRHVIETMRPDIVLVELDEKRLPRIGFQGGVADLQLPCVAAVPQEILDACPAAPEDVAYQQSSSQQPWWQAAQNLVQEGLVQAFTVVARKVLTSMYDDKGNNMGGQKGGGEFLAAIQAAQNVSTSSSSTDSRRPIEIILGDRDSVETIRRAATLAMRSGKPWQVLERFRAVSNEEMSRIYDTVVQQQGLEQEEDEVVINTAVMEALKSNPALRQDIFDRLQSEVPQFARAVLWERDFIMAEGMRRQALHRLLVENSNDNDPSSPLLVVAVVGAAHVPGMVQHLKKNTTSATLAQ